MTESQRRGLLTLGHLALAEVEASHLDQDLAPTSPYVFEDALRELLPSSHVYLADRIAESRGGFQETGYIRTALHYLQADLPITLRAQRVTAAVAPMLERAARRGVFDHEWWRATPLVRSPGQPIHAAVRIRSGYSSSLSPLLARHARAHVLRELLAKGLQVYSPGQSVPAAIRRLAGRIADVVMETT